MADDRVLKAFIHNTGEPPIPEIRGYLQEVGFLHAPRMQRGFKLDLTLISSLVERWRLETHTFHLSCGKCTITLKDVALQLGLLVDGSVITGLAVISGKVDLFHDNVGKSPEQVQSCRPDGKYRFYILESPTHTCSRWWNHGPSYVILLNELEDVRLLLDQYSEIEFEWMSYADPEIISCFPPEMLDNWKMWDVKVLLVVYAAMEMHRHRQFGYRQ
ncbi:hypothetical protein CXB51_019133 [Gossypium anomalum]|uniref:Aminotransferase-like plant mobile domain-containing protein n=1 Tax=Gossypium anomalum TaxID=47600 RepID=A0A8J5YKH2_9ROSI|nr:hypothetical protein CXB51_019133 [Gossypium anomalum]